MATLLSQEELHSNERHQFDMFQAISQQTTIAGILQDQFLECVQAVKDAIKTRDGNLRHYHKFLYQTFGREYDGDLQLHCDLMKLPFRAFITTNYDQCLEHAFCRTFQGLMCKT